MRCGLKLNPAQCSGRFLPTQELSCKPVCCHHCFSKVLLQISVLFDLTRNDYDYKRIHVFEYLFNSYAHCFFRVWHCLLVHFRTNIDWLNVRRVFRDAHGNLYMPVTVPLPVWGGKREGKMAD